MKRGGYIKRRKPLRKHSKNKISVLKRKAWAIFSKWIRNRDNWTCFTCGSRFTGAGLHAGHFVSRSHNATFFDELNVNAQCYPCNIYKRGNSGEYARRLIEKYGQRKFKALLERGRGIKQFKETELLEIIRKYQR